MRLRWLWIIALVGAIDQTTKWLAGHAGEAAYEINAGVGNLWPRALDGLWSGPTSGALLDLAATVALSAIVWVALHARPPITAGLLTSCAGEISNLADRWGLSFLTAPAPHPRGVVDLSILGGANPADYAIEVGLIVLAAAALASNAALTSAIHRMVIVARTRWRLALVIATAAVAGAWVGWLGEYGQARADHQYAALAATMLRASAQSGPGLFPLSLPRPLSRGAIHRPTPIVAGPPPSLACPGRGRKSLGARRTFAHADLHAPRGIRADWPVGRRAPPAS